MIEVVMNTSRTYIIIAILLFILILYTYVRIVKKQNRKKELQTLADDKKREEMLDNIILNAHSKDRVAMAESVPYEVDYSSGGNKTSGKSKKGKKPDAYMLQLTEHSELSMRKHVVNPRNVVRIGSRANENTIIVSDVGGTQCEIFLYQNNVWIRDVGEYKMVIVKRKRNRAYASEQGIQLKSGDIILVGKTSFDVEFI